MPDLSHDPNLNYSVNDHIIFYNLNYKKINNFIEQII